MTENANAPDPIEPQSSTPAGCDTTPTGSVPDTPPPPDIIVAPDFDSVEMGENPEGSIVLDFEIKTGLE